jgi:hypothetical protein
MHWRSLCSCGCSERIAVAAIVRSHLSMLRSVYLMATKEAPDLKLISCEMAEESAGGRDDYSDYSDQTSDSCCWC